VPALLEPGERVIPKEVVREHEPEIQQMMGGEEGTVLNQQIFLDGRELAGWITKQIRNRNITVDARAIV